MMLLLPQCLCVCVCFFFLGGGWGRGGGPNQVTMWKESLFVLGARKGKAVGDNKTGN